MSTDMPIQWTILTYSDDPEVRFIEVAVWVMDRIASDLDVETRQRVLRWLNARYLGG